jgi:hypothetical protein
MPGEARWDGDIDRRRIHRRAEHRLRVIVSIALPHLREGNPVLTDRGDRLSRRVSRRVDAVARVVGDTLTGLVAGVGGRSAEQHRTHPQPRSR